MELKNRYNHHGGQESNGIINMDRTTSMTNVFIQFQLNWADN